MHLSSLKVGTCSEFLDASNSIDTKTSTMQSEDCSCLQDNQAWDKASGPSKNMSENLAPYEDGDLNNKLSSFNSDSTSGVFSSSNSSNESCKHDSSNVKVCLSLEESYAQAGNITDANVDEGRHVLNEAQKLSVTHAVSSHSCCLVETAESCYEVTIHRTVLSPGMSNSSMEESNTERKKTLVALKESSSELHASEQSVLNQQAGCLLGRDEKGKSSRHNESPSSESENSESEIHNASMYDQHFFEVADQEKELEKSKLHEYFDTQRTGLCGFHQNDANEIEVIQCDIERDSTSKTKSNVPSRAECVYQLDDTSREGFKVNVSPMYTTLLEKDDELDIEEKEYAEAREFSAYSKYTQGPFIYHPMPLDNFLEEGTNFQIHHVHWAFPSVANEYCGDNFTAVVPFANKMKEDDHEKYPKRKSTLKEKLQGKLQKLKQFLGRTSRRVESASDDEDFKCEDLDQELFLLQIHGSWNLCYETEAVEELSHARMSAIVSLGRYRPPSFDDARKLIAKNPSLCTIIEEGEEIGANEVDYTNDF